MARSRELSPNRSRMLSDFGVARKNHNIAIIEGRVVTGIQEYEMLMAPRKQAEACFIARHSWFATVAK